MGQNNKRKVLELFYEYPDKKFTVRKISIKTRIPRSTVHKILLQLKKEEMINKDNSAKNNLKFRIKKTNHFIEKIVDSGLIKEIITMLNPSCIILFGSIRKGDSMKESDIDLFIESSMKKQPNLRKFEKKLGHKIQVFIKADVNKLHANLFNNVINGIKIYGSFKIK